MKLWLDDIRDPRSFGHFGFHWVKTASEAIAFLKSGDVTFASLDHDLTDKQTVYGGYLGEIFEDGAASGYDVVCWLEQNPGFLPVEGVNVHSANPAGRDRMQKVLEKLFAERNSKVDAPA